MPNNKLLKTLTPVAHPSSESSQVPAPVWDAPVIDATVEEEESPIGDFAHTLYRRKGTILLILLAGVAVTAFITANQDRLYQSTASVEIQGVNENFLNLHEVDPMSPNNYSPESYVETQAEILRQDWLIERTAQKLNVAAQPEFHPKPGAWTKIKEFFGAKATAGTQAADTTAVLKKHLKIKSSRDSRLIDIVFTAQNPQFAADFVNTLAQEFIEQSVESRRQAAAQIREWLSPQLDALSAKLRRSETELDAYARAAGLMFTEGQQSLAQDKLKQLQDELAKAEDDRIAKQSQWQLAATKLPETLMDDPAIRDYDAKLADLRRQMADLGSILTPENYKVARLKAQVDELETARAGEVKRIQQRLENDYKSAEGREDALKSTYVKQSGLVSNLSDKITRYNNLKHEVDTNRQFYDSMLQRIDEASIASAVRQSNMRVVGAAKPATEPSQPNPPLNYGVGVFASLALGIGLVLLQEQSDKRLRSPGDAGQYLNLPELGAIRKYHTLPIPKLLKLGNGNGGGNALERITWEERQSQMSESFRATVASIISARTERDGPRVLVVTSSLPREGKTTVTSNLAIALAEISMRVLVIDGDIRRPRLHDIFHVDNTWGLTDVLDEKNTTDEATEIAAKTAVPHLHVLPSGPCPDNIFTLLLSDRMQWLMRRFRREFDYIIVDAPPCLEFADARILARYADAAVLVVRANHADRKTALAAAQRLMLDGIPILGTILNDWNPTVGTGSNGYGYSAYGNVAGRATS